MKKLSLTVKTIMACAVLAAAASCSKQHVELGVEVNSRFAEQNGIVALGGVVCVHGL